MRKLRGVTVETLVPQNARKREALGSLKHHVAANWQNSYVRLVGASPEDDAEILDFLKRKGEILDVKSKLRRAKVTKPEFVQAMVDLLSGGNDKMMSVANKKDLGEDVWSFFRKINRPRRISHER